LNKEKGRRTYWFILDNYVHVSLKKDAVLFYNPLTGDILEYTGPAGETVTRLVKRLQSPRNMLVICLSERELADPVVAGFVSDMRGRFMADLLENSPGKGKPVQLMPHVKVHKDASFIKKISFRSVGERIMDYLGEIFLYVNGVCSLNCEMCASAYRQFLCCTRKFSAELDIASIKNLFIQLQGIPRFRLNILGGDIFSHSQWDELAGLLNRLPGTFEKVFYSHYLNLYKREERLALFPPGSVSFEVLVTFPVQEQQWRWVLKCLRVRGISAQFLFVISTERDIDDAEALIESSGLEGYAFFPFFNGGNRQFFEENIFLDREDIREARPGPKEIQARQLVNLSQFGRLTVLSNGSIYANVNAPRLGVLNRDGLHRAIYREMDRGKSWRRTRKQVKPCKGCTFEALCPPLSGCEYALGRNNLCHIK
jgi:pseudo-rSAM protein